MSHARYLAAAGVATIGLALPGAVGARGAVTQPLIATVGSATSPNDYVISLKDSTGATVSHVDPGTYTVDVHDYATIHNFHLFGPGVDKASDIEGTTTTDTWTVTFTNGTYKFMCDAHPYMHGSFTSGTILPAPKPQKLLATVGPKRKITLKTAAGGRVKQLTAGPFKITVKDLTKSDNFHLFGAGVNKRTGVRFHGTVTWSVKFRTGKVTYRSDAHKSLAGSFRVLGSA